jgi:hypothetical protein
VRERAGKEEFVGVKETAIVERVDGGDYQALVAAIHRAVVRFGVDLADGVAAAVTTAAAP